MIKCDDWLIRDGFKVGTNDFSRAEDAVIRQSTLQGFSVEDIAPMLKNKYNKSQINQRIKMLMKANQRRSSNSKIGAKLAGLIRRYGAKCKVEPTEATEATATSLSTDSTQLQREELNEAIWRAVRRDEMIEREKKTGRPPKSPTMMVIFFFIF